MVGQKDSARGTSWAWEVSSNGCGGGATSEDIAALARSAAVSVKEQKNGGLWLQPIGRHRGTPTHCEVAVGPGRTTASSRAASGESWMR